MIRSNLKTLTPVIFPIIFLYYSDFEKELYVATAAFLFFFLVFYKHFFKGKIVIDKEDYLFKNTYFYPLLFLYLILTQNAYLNFETITWDVSSYLVAANEINLGYIPLETQWESKGPLTIYIYYFFSKLANSNYLYFKLLNDIVLFITICIFISTLKLKGLSDKRYLIASMFIITIFSIQWFVSEFTEFYCLPLIALSNYYFIKNNSQSSLYIGLLFGLAFLINQGSVLFFIPILILKFIENDKASLIKSFTKLSIGFIFPNLISIITYWSRGLLDVYFANYIDIPLGYSNESYSSFYELRVFLREISEINQFIYFFLVSLLIFYLLVEINSKRGNVKKYFNLVNLNFLFALAYYFIAGHNFYHHLVYLVYFLTFFIVNIHKTSQLNLISILLLFSVITTSVATFPLAYNNLLNVNQTYNNYPLKQVAQEIDENINNKDFTILALDSVLILHYLDKTNFSYIVHPTNHYQKYITDVLINLDKINEDNIQYLIGLKPDVIICNTMSIDVGGKVISTDPSDYGEDIREGSKQFCDFSNFVEDYFQLDTTLYRTDPNLNYYYDPYKDMNIFIKKGI